MLPACQLPGAACVAAGQDPIVSLVTPLMDVELLASTPNHGTKKKEHALTPSPVQLRLDSKFDAVGNKDALVSSSARRCLKLTFQGVPGADGEDKEELTFQELPGVNADCSDSSPEIEDSSPEITTTPLKIRAKQGTVGSWFKGHRPPKDFANMKKFEEARAQFYEERLLRRKEPGRVQPRSNLLGRVVALRKARKAQSSERNRVCQASYA
jgi:hypothetical protein